MCPIVSTANDSHPPVPLTCGFVAENRGRTDRPRCTAKLCTEVDQSPGVFGGSRRGWAVGAGGFDGDEACEADWLRALGRRRGGRTQARASSGASDATGTERVEHLAFVIRRSYSRVPKRGETPRLVAARRSTRPSGGAGLGFVGDPHALLRGLFAGTAGFGQSWDRLRGPSSPSG